MYLLSNTDTTVYVHRYILPLAYISTVEYRHNRICSSLPLSRMPIIQYCHSRIFYQILPLSLSLLSNIATLHVPIIKYCHPRIYVYSPPCIAPYCYLCIGVYSHPCILPYCHPCLCVYRHPRICIHCHSCMLLFSQHVVHCFSDTAFHTHSQKNLTPLSNLVNGAGCSTCIAPTLKSVEL